MFFIILLHFQIDFILVNKKFMIKTMFKILPKFNKENSSTHESLTGISFKPQDILNSEQVSGHFYYIEVSFK